MITLYKYTHPSRAETIIWALSELGFELPEQVKAYLKKLSKREKFHGR